MKKFIELFCHFWAFCWGQKKPKRLSRCAIRVQVRGLNVASKGTHSGIALVLNILPYSEGEFLYVKSAKLQFESSLELNTKITFVNSLFFLTGALPKNLNFRFHFLDSKFAFHYAITCTFINNAISFPRSLFKQTNPHSSCTLVSLARYKNTPPEWRGFILSVIVRTWIMSVIINIIKSLCRLKFFWANQSANRM